jgi:hypothetical protein
MEPRDTPTPAWATEAVHVVEPDPEWATQAEDYAAEIQALLTPALSRRSSNMCSAKPHNDPVR